MCPNNHLTSNFPFDYAVDLYNQKWGESGCRMANTNCLPSTERYTRIVDPDLEINGARRNKPFAG